MMFYCILSITYSSAKAQHIPNRSKIHEGETVTFMCDTRATRNHTWIIEVIGSNKPGHQITIDESAVVTPKSSTPFDNVNITVGFVDSFYLNGVIALESGLSITILESTGYEDVSVTCQINNGSNNATIILQVEVHEQGIKLMLM